MQDPVIPTPQPSSQEPQTSIYETPQKKKKDLVEQKLDKGKTKKDEKSRAPSPKNKKRAPSPEQAPMGSAVSLKSNASRASRGKGTRHLYVLEWSVVIPYRSNQGIS